MVKYTDVMFWSGGFLLGLSSQAKFNIIGMVESWLMSVM